MALGSTQPLTEMSTRCISWGNGGRCVKLTTLPPSCAVVMKSGNLNFLEPSGPLQAYNGTALPFLPFTMRLIVQWSLHFVAFGIFSKAVTVTSVKSLGHCPFSHMMISEADLKLFALCGHRTHVNAFKVTMN